MPIPTDLPLNPSMPSPAIPSIPPTFLTHKNLTRLSHKLMYESTPSMYPFTYVIFLSGDGRWGHRDWVAWQFEQLLSPSQN